MVVSENLKVAFLIVLIIFALYSSSLISNAICTYSAWIYVCPDHGHRGVDIYISGDNFTADSIVYIYFDDKLIATAETDWDGWFGEYVEVPVNVGPGIHTIKAVDQSGVKAITSFTVIEPTLYINVSKAKPYDIIRATGSGYAAYQWYLVAVDGLIVNSFIMARGNETIDASFAVPPITSGDHYVSIIYVSLVTGNHVVVASRRLWIENGYVDNSSFTRTISRLTEKISVVQNNLENISIMINKIETSISTMSANISTLRDKLEEAVKEIRINIDILNQTVMNLYSLVRLLAKNETVLVQRFSGIIHNLTESITRKINVLNNTVADLESIISEMPWRNYTDTRIKEIISELAAESNAVASLRAMIEKVESKT